MLDLNHKGEAWSLATDRYSAFVKLAVIEHCAWTRLRPNKPALLYVQTDAWKVSWTRLH